MTTSRTRVLLAIGLVLSGALCAELDAADQTAIKSVALTSAQLEEARMFSLPEARVFTAGVAGSSGLPATVVLSARSYRYTASVIRSGAVVGQQGGYVVCYELSPQDPTSPYRWSFWSYSWLGNFRLFGRQAGDNYLAWAEGGGVSFAEVTEPRDAVVELTRFLCAPPETRRTLVPVAFLVPASRHWGRNALFADIRVTSLRRLDDGTFELKVTNPQGTESYTIVGQGMDWHLVQPGAEPAAPPAKPEAAAPAPEKQAEQGPPKSETARPEAAPPEKPGK